MVSCAPSAVNPARTLSASTMPLIPPTRGEPQKRGLLRIDVKAFSFLPFSKEKSKSKE